MVSKYVLITAAGAGVRMNSHLPKQFLELKGKPILIHTISKFIRYASDIHIVLVLPEEQIPLWNELSKSHNFNFPVEVVAGGPTRFHSVKNGLNKVKDNALVAIHDGVRPLVSLNTIQQVFHLASKFGNAIPVTGVNESVRILDKAFSKVIDRNSLRIVQTPQCFKSEIIKKAYQENYKESFTDDASVLENFGQRIFLVEGNQSNIKITSPEDLLIAAALL